MSTSNPEFLEEFVHTFDPLEAAGSLEGLLSTLDDPDTRRDLGRVMRALTLTPDMVLALLSRLAATTAESFISSNKEGDWFFDYDKAKASGALALIKKMAVDRTGKITIEFYDRIDILVVILRAFGKINTSVTDQGARAATEQLTSDFMNSVRLELEGFHENLDTRVLEDSGESEE